MRENVSKFDGVITRLFGIKDKTTGVFNPNLMERIKFMYCREYN